MKLNWKAITKDSKDSDKAHNLALFEIFITIINNRSDGSIKEESQALCEFAMMCMFPDIPTQEEYNKIMVKKDREIENIVSSVPDTSSITGVMVGEA